MNKNVLVISSSLRKNSNSECLADACIRGAKEAGNIVEKVVLTDKSIQFCQGCLACLKTKQCIIDDDSRAITEKMKNADVIVFASPVYYFSISGQLKTLLDRANSLYASEYQFRDIYFLSSAAEDGIHTVEGSIKTIEGWVDCFDKAVLKKTVFAGGVDGAGDILDHPALLEAYELGKQI
ncbi:flavodoxin family protein [Clostridiaceae bacterium DONG20-135]|uniref:Flavodoxin family protein n=1 Tax=Copranaerobaculum intestinale TaxID=2692629 RepID=A0A6N8U926_9FIRM|nr:flavodoxin family protein [Copranaerobaculum intestinale]MXQ73069.1 flavodoxin family protein [Copranaerobaculum intestinale]